MEEVRVNFLGNSGLLCIKPPDIFLKVSRDR